MVTAVGIRLLVTPHLLDLLHPSPARPGRLLHMGRRRTVLILLHSLAAPPRVLRTPLHKDFLTKDRRKGPLGVNMALLLSDKGNGVVLDGETALLV